jgi:hypothetical protein
MNLNLPPAAWLCLWIIGTAACCFLCTWIGYWIGYDHSERDMHPTPRHRAGDPAPGPPELAHAGRLDPVDEPEWSFFGGAALEQQPGAAEYQLMVREAGERASGPFDLPAAMAAFYALEQQPAAQAAEPCETCDESDSEFTRRQAREVDELIDRIKTETDHLIHTRFTPGSDAAYWAEECERIAEDAATPDRPG